MVDTARPPSEHNTLRDIDFPTGRCLPTSPAHPLRVRLSELIDQNAPEYARAPKSEGFQQHDDAGCFIRSKHEIISSIVSKLMPPGGRFMVKKKKSGVWVINTRYTTKKMRTLISERLSKVIRDYKGNLPPIHHQTRLVNESLTQPPSIMNSMKGTIVATNGDHGHGVQESAAQEQPPLHAPSRGDARTAPTPTPQAFKKRSRSSQNSVCSQEPPTQRQVRDAIVVVAKMTTDGQQQTGVGEFPDSDSDSQISIMCESISTFSVHGAASFKTRLKALVYRPAGGRSDQESVVDCSGSRRQRRRAGRPLVTPRSLKCSSKVTTRRPSVFNVVQPRRRIGPIADPNPNDILVCNRVDSFPNAHDDSQRPEEIVFTHATPPTISVFGVTFTPTNVSMSTISDSGSYRFSSRSLSKQLSCISSLQ